MPTACRLSQTLGVYGFFPIFCRCKFGSCLIPALDSLCSGSSHPRKVESARRCQSRSARAVRPASLAASARLSSRHHSPVKVRRIKHARAHHTSKIAAFSHETLAVHAPLFAHFKQLPVSQRLKSQCIVMPTRSNTVPPVRALVAPVKIDRQPWRPAMEVSEFKAKRSVVQQTPNHSFKRTGLRPAA